MLKKIIVILVTIVSLYAQYPYEFVEKAQNIEYGSIYDVAFGNDSILYVSHLPKGLRAYRFNGNSLEYLAQQDEDMYRNNREMVLGNDNTIFLVESENGISAYGFHDNSFERIANTNEDGRIWGIGRYNEKIILASGMDYKLIAYKFEDNSFSTLARSQEEDGGHGIAIGPDSTIFLAAGRDGLFAYRFDDTSFTNIGYIDVGGWVNDVLCDSTGNIFLANGASGIKAYHFNGSEFTLIAHMDSSYYSGLMELGSASRLDIDKTGNIFLANGSDGVRAFRYKNDEFIHMDHIDSDAGGINLCVDDDHHVFNAAGSLIDVYSYLDSTFSECFTLQDAGQAEDVVLYNDNTVLLANGYAGLFAYEFNEHGLTKTANIYKGLLSLPNGHYAKYGEAKKITIGDDGLIYLVNGSDDIRIFSYENRQLNYLDKIVVKGVPEAVAVDSNGFIYCASGNWGLQVFQYNGVGVDSLTSLLEDVRIQDLSGFEYPPNAEDVYLGPDGLIYLANNWDGLRVYSFDGTRLSLVRHGLSESIISGYRIKLDESGKIYYVGGNGFNVYDFDGLNYQPMIANGDTISPGGLYIETDSTYFITRGRYIQNYKLVDDEPVLQASKSNGVYTVNSIIKTNDSLVFVAGGSDGLTMYSYTKNLNYSEEPEDSTDQEEPSDSTDIDLVTSLSPNYPNPFNLTTVIGYSISVEAAMDMQFPVIITIYDISGRKIKQWSYTNQAAGSYEIVWNGKNQSGNPVPSGVYIYRMVAGEFVQSKKMLLLK